MEERQDSSGAEQSLLGSWQLYERANTVPVMLYDSVLAPDGTNRYINVAPEPCREILELNPDALLKDMNLLWHIIHPDDLDRFHREVLAANEAGKEFLTEVRIITSSGNPKWLLVNSKPNPSEPGKPVVWSGYLQDITTRKQAEEKLKETEQRLRLLIEHSTNLFYMHTTDHILTYVSPHSRQFFDCEPEEAMVGWTELITDNPLNRDAILATQRAIDTGERQPPYQIECIGKKGRTIWVEANEAPIIDNGVTVGISGTLTDITEKKKAEEALHASRNLLHTVLENVPTRVFWKDADLNYLGCNTAFARSAGFSKPADLLGKNDLQMCWHKQAEEIQADDKRIMNGETPGIGIEKPLTAPDGKMTLVRTHKVPMYDKEGTVIGMLGTDEDITERKQAEEKLVESHDLLSNLARLVPGVIYQYRLFPDGSSAFPYASPGMNDIYEVTPEEVQDDATVVFGRLHPDDYGRVASLILDSAQTLKTFYCEFRVILPRQGLRWRWSQAYPERMEDGGTLWHGIISDITDRKQAEVDRLNLEKQLQQAQRIESIGHLAGGVAHDFNNMLGVILGHAELAKRKAERSKPVADDLEEICTAARRSADLTQKLLTFARKQPITPKVLDLNETITEMLSMLHRVIGENIQLSWNPASNLWPAEMDPSQLDQILANLCVNARHAVGENGKISIKTCNSSFSESDLNNHPEAYPGDYVQLSVSDDGHGIDKDILPQIFEPFFTTKEVGQGTGLGLATVFGAVKQNHGFIEVLSSPGQGTTFHIFLPRTAKELVVETETSATPHVGGDETILLVEDDEMLLNLVASMLDECGYQVLSASTVNRAISLTKDYAGPIHLLLSDMIMPEMNGRDLRDRLQQIRPELKVLFMSGYSDEIISSQGIMEKGTHFLQKPVSFEELTTKVREVLSQD